MSISIGVGGGFPVVVSPYADITHVVATWRAVGGCWELTAKLIGENLASFVPSWLGAVCRHDEWDWYGRIVTVDLTVGKAKRRWDLLERYANRVVTIIGTASIETWQEDASDIERYGKYELVLEGDGGISVAQADDWADRTLTKRLATIPFGLGLNKFSAPVHVVDITAIGLLPLTARIKNNYEVATGRIGLYVGGLADQKISTIISEISDNWSDNLLAASFVSENTTTVDQVELQGKNSWALLEELTAWTSETNYFIRSDSSGSVIYYANSSSASNPDYDIYENSVRRHGGASALLAGECRPGWYRDVISGVAMFGHEIKAREGEIMPDITTSEVDTDPFLDIAPEPER